MKILPLQRQLKIDDLEKIFWAAQMAVRESNDDPIKNFKNFVIPDNMLSGRDVFNKMVIFVVVHIKVCY